MSDRSMKMAMELFRTNREFRNEVRNSENRGATVSQILSKYAVADDPEKSAAVAGEGLTRSEQETINQLPWSQESDEQLIDRIGKTGCTYT